MQRVNLVDVAFDHRSDANGKDLDKFSPRLKRHHQLLWNKPLPSGELFELKTKGGRYLVLRPDDLVYSLASDQISNSFRTTVRMKKITSQVPDDELDEFQYLGATLGGTILFPGKQINRRRTINQSRGMNHKIADRFDLTLECIRLQYAKMPNPLQDTLSIYWAFFELFETFEEYVRFFLLQDLVVDGQVRFFLPSDDFTKPALPQDVGEYQNYMANSKAFLNARARRIHAWASEQGFC